MSGSGRNNETVHISLGSTANYLTSHFLNLQGLAATTSGGGGASRGGGIDDDDDDDGGALCDPSVTHDVRPLDDDSSYSSYHGSSRYAYVPRTLIVDGRDSFGTPWGGGDAPSSSSSSMPSPSPSPSPSSSAAWSGAVSKLNPSSVASSFIGKGQTSNDDGALADPLTRFREAASAMGLSPVHSRFRAAPPHYRASSYNAGGDGGGGGRHVQWDDDEEEEEEEEEEADDDDSDGYHHHGRGRDGEQTRQEARRRRLERMEDLANDARRDWNIRMVDAWEEAFYPCSGDGDADGTTENAAPNDGAGNGVPSLTTTTMASTITTAMTTTKPDGGAYNQAEREIKWHDYWLPPRPASSRYRVPLPFDTSTSFDDPSNDRSTCWSTWSTSYDAGYRPGSVGGGGGGVVAGSGLGGGGGGGGIAHSWREHVLSESLRRMLESCDVVKGFNIFVDGGGYCRGSSSPTHSAAVGSGTRGNKHAERLSDIVAGGGFHAGLAASLMEELSEECRSAGRWAVMLDPPHAQATRAVTGRIGDESVSGGDDTEGEQVHRFRSHLNAGLALHGLSTNADAFLPVSIDGAYRALHSVGASRVPTTTQNRVLFEGSAAIALALEASTLFYRLRRRTKAATASHRSRIGIQSGFYQGYSSNAAYEEFDSEPFASAPSMTYHEFLACARPSSDRRRSILELDALLRPISYPSAPATSSPWVNNVGPWSTSMLASLQSSGLIAGSTNGMGELQSRMIRGTSIEQMMIEQQHQQYRSSRARTSSRPSEPGEWLDDISMKTSNGGGLLSSLSGNSIPFGMRSDHHHFALSTSLRPPESDLRSFSSTPGSGNCATTALLRPIMESMGVRYRPEVSLGVVVKDTVVDLTGLGAYWRVIFSDGNSTTTPPSSSTNEGIGGNIKSPQSKPIMMSPNERASHSPVLSVLGNGTRSYPRLNSISHGFHCVLHSQRNRGYFSRDVMAGIVPERDDCEEALEYCRELVDVYEPPMGSGLVSGRDENENMDAYFDDHNINN